MQWLWKNSLPILFSTSLPPKPLISVSCVCSLAGWGGWSYTEGKTWVFLGISTASLGEVYLSLLPWLAEFRRCSSLLLACALLSFCLLARQDLWVLSGGWFTHIFTPKVVFQPPPTMASQEKKCLYTRKNKNNHPQSVRKEIRNEVYSLSWNSSFPFFSFTLPT